MKEKMCTWQQGYLVFGRARKPRMLCVLFLMSGFVELFVSDSWYYQIQTTRLFEFFMYIFDLGTTSTTIPSPRKKEVNNLGDHHSIVQRYRELIHIKQVFALTNRGITLYLYNIHSENPVKKKACYIPQAFLDSAPESIARMEYLKKTVFFKPYTKHNALY